MICLRTTLILQVCQNRLSLFQFWCVVRTFRLLEAFPQQKHSKIKALFRIELSQRFDQNRTWLGLCSEQNLKLFLEQNLVIALFRTEFSQSFFQNRTQLELFQNRTQSFFQNKTQSFYQNRTYLELCSEQSLGFCSEQNVKDSLPALQKTPVRHPCIEQCIYEHYSPVHS